MAWPRALIEKLWPKSETGSRSHVAPVILWGCFVFSRCFGAAIRARVAERLQLPPRPRL